MTHQRAGPGAEEPDAALLNRVLWKIPNVLCLIGSRSGDEWNGMTLSWLTQVSLEPVLVAIGVDTKAVTNRLIRGGKAFSVNLWDRADTRTFVKFSKPAAKEGMTLNGRAIREGRLGVPIFEEAVAWMECSVVHDIPVGTHDIFLGEVVAAGFRPDVDDPDVARMEDTRMKYGGVKRGGH
jgi:flavin reductase (DIM6/NTAB) family NADH-FMN oxidoreductase RutF